MSSFWPSSIHETLVYHRTRQFFHTFPRSVISTNLPIFLLPWEASKHEKGQLIKTIPRQGQVITWSLDYATSYNYLQIISHTFTKHTMFFSNFFLLLVFHTATNSPSFLNGLDSLASKGNVGAILSVWKMKQLPYHFKYLGRTNRITPYCVVFYKTLWHHFLFVTPTHFVG